AFILAHIPTFASRMTEYREYYDPLLDEAAASLLYFPTGGGKSEAFYGTLLFAMFLDRLRCKTRVVTARVGGWPFEIGFWVGGNNTPNRYAYVPSIVPLTTDALHTNDERLEEGVTG